MLKGSLPILLVLTLMWASSAVSQSESGGVPAQSDTTYVIGPGDTITVDVWGEEDISATLPVRRDGRINTPLVEDMVAVGKTPSELARDIESVLSEFYINPRVTILIVDSVGTFQDQVRVLGEVVNPGSFPYREGMTLLDVLSEAGGLTEFAAGRRSHVSRTVEGENMEIRVRIDRLMERGDRDENLSLLPGDIVVIPAARF